MTTGRINQITLLGMICEPRAASQRPVGASPSQESSACNTRDGRDTQRHEGRPTTDDFPSPAKYSQSTSRNAITRRVKTDTTPYRLTSDILALKIARGNRPADSQSESCTQTLNRVLLSRERLGVAPRICTRPLTPFPRPLLSSLDSQKQS